MLMNFGIEGESYSMVDGYPTFTDLIFNNPDGLTPDQAVAIYNSTSPGSSMVYDKRYYEQILVLPQQKEALKRWSSADASLQLPPITATADESSKLSTIMNDIYTYRDEMIFRFIMGQEPIENFDKYVQNIKDMNIDEALKIQQAALERYNAR
jgi:putative aldouronate transport system substrate-binding protein